MSSITDSLGLWRVITVFPNYNASHNVAYLFDCDCA